MKDHQKGILFASITALLWGFLAIGLKVALSFLDPFSVAWIRFSIAFGLLFIYHLIFARDKLSLIIKPPGFAIFAALCLGLNYFGFIYGLNFTSPSIAQIFIQTGPVLLAISGFTFFKESIHSRNITGIFLVIIGLLLFYFEKLTFFSLNTADFNKGVFWLLIGAIAWTSFAIFQKHLVKSYSPISLNLVLFLLPALLFIPTVDFPVFSFLKPWQYILIFFLGVNTLVAYICIALALKYIEANKLSVIITLNPVITLITMALLTTFEVTWIKSENFSYLIVFGALLVIVGAVLTTKKSKKHL